MIEGNEEPTSGATSRYAPPASPLQIERRQEFPGGPAAQAKLSSLYAGIQRAKMPRMASSAAMSVRGVVS